jgi:PKD repeat protein
MKKTISLAGVILTLLVIMQFTSCKEEDNQPDVIASFTSVVDSTNFKLVKFTNLSTNFSALSWNFGDNATSTDENPEHLYADLDDFVVVLTATSLDGKVTDSFTKTISIVDPNAELTKLVGEDSKTWKLLRSVTTGRYPLLVFPYNAEDPNTPTSLWWGMGLNNDELALRPCLLNDEWTFFRDGTFTFDAKGDYWAEGGVFDTAVDNTCQNTADPMVSINGEDLSAWGGGTFDFQLVTGNDPKLKAIGTGAFIGFLKSGTEYEVMKLDPMVQDEVDYNLVKLYDAEAGCDTLIVQCNYYFNVGDPAYGGSWRYTLVHYDNPLDEPPIPNPIPNTGFTYVLDGKTVTFTNTSTLADSYLWAFGDGETSTEINPVHTYAGDGMYDVTLTGYNVNGEKSVTQTITISSLVLTEAILTAGPWKLVLSGHSIYVGPGMGSDGWWICPLENLDGTKVGTVDDWSCMIDDEFIFSAGGGYEYKTNGGSRNDGYMDTIAAPGANNGCWTDAEIAASPGAPFGSCNTHTFTFTPAEGTARPIIVLTSGPEYAAFLGFMKGYYGGENSDGHNPPNGGFPTNQYEVMAYTQSGGKDVIVVSVDLTGDHSGTSAWTMTLER